jgi:nucleoside-diphosphate-sugar epimerase
MQTILGAGGAIGKELAKALQEFTDEVKLVSRNPKRVNDLDILINADLTNPENVLNAVKDSNIVYLTVGLPYKTKVWQNTWPLVMKNVIDACLKNQCKLVFFDNIYMYDGTNLNPITEDTPINPSSKKGKVRKEIVQMIWDAVKNHGLQAVIARCADFYGPSIKNTSALTEVVFNPLSKGKKANWLGSDKYKHSFTYTVDAAKATAILGNTEMAYGETWHLPTSENPLTGKEWIETIAKELGVQPKYQVAGKSLVRIIGLFSPVMHELVEMIYQYEKDYVFNSDKFVKKFNFKPTPYIDGIREIISKDYK